MDDFIRTNWQSILAGVFVVAVLGLLVKLLRPKQKVFAEDMTLNMSCTKCGWQGTVTKYNQVCRKCNSKELKPF